MPSLQPTDTSSHTMTVDRLARPARFERAAFRLGVAPISHREVTPDAKKCLEILGFSAFPIPSDTTL